MKRLLLIGLLLALAVPAHATSLDDARDLYAEGDYSAAIDITRPLAEAGAPEAMYELGVMLIEGRAGTPDIEAGREWTEKAAGLGNAPAQHALGLLYIGAAGDEPQWEKAAEWFRKAAGQGFAPAEYHLGVLYAEGTGVEQSLV